VIKNIVKTLKERALIRWNKEIRLKLVARTFRDFPATPSNEGAAIRALPVLQSPTSWFFPSCTESVTNAVVQGVASQNLAESCLANEASVDSGLGLGLTLS